MVDHKVHFGHDMRLKAVNGHEPISGFNESTGAHWVYCGTCGWVGRSYKGRWAEKSSEQWGVHAADIAMRREPDGGERHVNCACRRCRDARRSAREEAGRG